MKEVIFVYNADGGLFNTVTDFAHKIISPATYACQLCALTYGSFSMKKEWKDFIQQLPVTTVFLHKNEFEKEYSLPAALPAMFIKKDTDIRLLLSKENIVACHTLQELQDLVITRLSST